MLFIGKQCGTREAPAAPTELHAMKGGPSMLQPAPTQKHRKTAASQLSGEIFGTLINLSGRRRFTSQRLVLYAVLASLKHESAIETAREALRLFQDAHRALVEGNDDLPGVFCDSLQTAYYGPLQGDRHILDFIALAEQTLDAIQADFRQAAALLDELVRSATPLLAILNSITLVYEEESRRHAAMLKKQLHQLMNDIMTISKQARMVSFNAQVIAARAGDAGKEFSVVASVLTGITGEIDKLVQVALSESVA